MNNMKRFIEEHQDELFDLIIVGGGITGSAVAYEASTRGLKVAIIEKKDFGWGTSSATSKMIHGGLRYLKNKEFGLVRESLKERRILENIAPNYVHPFPLIVPSYEDADDKTLVFKIGLTLYDLMAFDKKWTWDKSKKIPSHWSISRDEIIAAAPDVKTENLSGGVVYYDCQNLFPERLTLAFIKSAIQHGAKASNYSEALDILFSSRNKVEGVKVRDLITGNEKVIRSSLVVNCGGPWADIILGNGGGEKKHSIRRSEGIHIITRKLRSDYGVVLRTPKGRHFFILPWREHSLIGTSDKEYTGSPDDYRVTRESIEDLIAEVNDSYGDGTLSYGDIVHAYGGLRPLVEDDTEGTYESSRKYEIFDNTEIGFEGLITVEGGKYTTSRNLAVNVMKTIGEKLDRNLGSSVTSRKYLYGCEIQSLEAYTDYLIRKNSDFDKKTVACLARNYGTESRHIMKLARENEFLRKRVTHDGEIMAEVVYAVRKEMALSLSDIMLRRTGMGTLGYPGDELTNEIGEIAGAELGWDSEKVSLEINEIKKKTALPE